jgi:hypothetical protein
LLQDYENDFNGHKSKLKIFGPRRSNKTGKAKWKEGGEQIKGIVLLQKLMF